MVHSYGLHKTYRSEQRNTSCEISGVPMDPGQVQFTVLSLSWEAGERAFHWQAKQKQKKENISRAKGTGFDK